MHMLLGISENQQPHKPYVGLLGSGITPEAQSRGATLAGCDTYPSFLIPLSPCSLTFTISLHGMVPAFH